MHNKKVELTGASSAALRGKFGRPGQLTFSVGRHRDMSAIHKELQ